MATQPQYTAQPILEYVQINTANANRDGTGTLGTLTTGPNVSAGSGVGKRIIRVTVCSTGTTAAGVIRFFLSNDNGTTKRLLCEKIVPAVTPSTTLAAWRTEVAELVGLILPGGTGNIVYVSTEKGSGSTPSEPAFNVFCESGLL